MVIVNMTEDFPVGILFTKNYFARGQLLNQNFCELIVYITLHYMFFSISAALNSKSLANFSTPTLDTCKEGRDKSGLW